MGGGLMQLVAYGAQDVYLTGNPQITLFKVVYRRHTNFSLECIELSSETVASGANRSMQVLRNGDLVTKSYLEVDLPQLTCPANYTGKYAWCKRVGHAVIKSAELLIGGSPIDKHIGTWLDVWYELTHTNEQERGYNKMVGDVPELTALTNGNVPAVSNNPLGQNGTYRLFIPLQFWFCRNYGLALPLIALQYHDVRIKVELENLSNLIVYTNSSGAAPNFGSMSVNLNVLSDYVYLDAEERKRFAQVGHEYLIEQLQYEDAFTLQQGQGYTINFNHPCKEMIFTQKLGLYAGALGGASVPNRFLSYCNGNNWNDAVTEAAENVASGMFGQAVLGTHTPSAQYPYALSFASTVSGSAVSSVTVNTGPAGSSSSTCEVVLTASSIALTTPAAWYIPIDPAALRVNGFNMSSKLQYVTANLNMNNILVLDAGHQPTLTVEVSDDNHTLSMTDISVPLNSGFSAAMNSLVVDARHASRKLDDVFITQFNNYGLRLDGTGNCVSTVQLKFNGHDRFNQREGNYFNYVQPYQHHTRTPADGINVYSFGIHPEQHQPTGTANLSRIDSTRLNIVYSDIYSSQRMGAFSIDFTTNTKVYLFVVNYNVLRIMSGMGGLAYSN
jgi:hypothetical protein